MILAASRATPVRMIRVAIVPREDRKREEAGVGEGVDTTVGDGAGVSVGSSVGVAGVLVAGLAVAVGVFTVGVGEFWVVGAGVLVFWGLLVTVGEGVLVVADWVTVEVIVTVGVGSLVGD